jgi:hypothetical protein
MGAVAVEPGKVFQLVPTLEKSPVLSHLFNLRLPGGSEPLPLVPVNNARGVIPSPILLAAPKPTIGGLIQTPTLDNLANSIGGTLKRSSRNRL